VLFLFLVLATPAFADDDDDALLDTKTLGDPLPERLEQLEREWADETGVGVDDPVDPPDEIDAPAAEPAVAAEDDEDDQEHVTPTTLVPVPPPAKAAKSPLRNAEPTDPPRPGGRRSDPLSSPED
jgi:hypothetical protein